MERKEILIFSIILALFLVQAVNGEVILGQMKSSYNLGDTLTASVTIKVAEDSDSFLNVKLICSQGEKELLYVPVKLAAGEEKSIRSNVSLTKSFLGDLKGNCEIRAEYNGDEQSQSFEILDSLLVELNIAETTVSAGSNISIEGNVERGDGSAVDGFVDLIVEGTSINVKTIVKDGKFSSTILFPDNLKAGSYTLKANAYEEEGNSGLASSIIIIGSEAKKLEIALTKNSLTPPGNLSFKILMYDQADTEGEGSASVSIKDSYADAVYNKIVKTGEVVELNLPANSSAGYWNIEASANELSVRRLFYVGENEQASFEISNSTLIITNVGNVWYRKAVEIDIGDEAQIKQMDLDLGESVRLRLLAPIGIYRVSVTDGSNSLNVGDVSLTGNVIGVEDVRNQANMIVRYPIVWLFLIVVIGLFFFMTIEGIKKRGFSISGISPKGAIERISKVIKPASTNRGMEVRRETRESLQARSNFADAVKSGEKIEAEYSVVMKGSRTVSTVISLKIKSFGRSGEIKEKIKEIFRELSYKKAAIMDTQEFIIIILSPVLTKTFNNEVTGIKIALQLKESLLKYKDVDFGIGVHVGEIIGGVERGRFQFTPLGTTLSYAKKISDLAEKEVLLSRDLHNKTMSEVKAVRMNIYGNELYKVESVTDREKYSNFIANFKSRQAEEAKRNQQQQMRDSLSKSS